MLFEEYLRSSAIAGNSRSVARLFAPVGIVALLVLAALQIPLAWRMARRIRNAQRDREQLLQHAVDASDRERQLIAAGLHDGVVQELAGQSFQMAAAVEQDRPPEELRAALTEGAAGTRNAIRQLRSLLLEIYPPALRDQGLAAALPDLVAPLTARGIEVSMDVQDDLALPTEVEQLVFRTAQEAVRNAGAHAAAGHVRIGVERSNGLVRLRVSDDGRGFDAGRPGRAAGRRPPRPGHAAGPGHVGRRHPAGDVGAGRGHHRAAGGAGLVIRVVVIDDHPIVRDGLVRLIGSDPELEVVGSGGDGDAAVAICAELEPDVALMDLSMPGVGGVEATRLIGERAPGVQVIVLTSFMDRERVTEALDAGAIGYLLKDAEPGQLLQAIHAAARGESPLDPRAARAMLAAQRTPDRLDALTSREREVLALVAEGLPNKQIARRLEISEKTVKAHLTSAFRTIGVDDRMQAGLWARRNGL